MSNEKTAGQLAYERDLAMYPAYWDGQHRPSWTEIMPMARLSWELNPTDRPRPGWVKSADEMVQQ